MIGGVVMVTPRGPRRTWLQKVLHRKPQPTLRQLGAIVSDLQAAEARNIHANREHCLGCKIAASMMHAMALNHLPGARIAARLVDEQEADR